MNLNIDINTGIKTESADLQGYVNLPPKEPQNLDLSKLLIILKNKGIINIDNDVLTEPQEVV